MVFHVLNRANARSTIFERPEDCAAFERVLSEALDRVDMRVRALHFPQQDSFDYDG